MKRLDSEIRAESYPGLDYNLSFENRLTVTRELKASEYTSSFVGIVFLFLFLKRKVELKGKKFRKLVIEKLFNWIRS